MALANDGILTDEVLLQGLRTLDRVARGSIAQTSEPQSGESGGPVGGQMQSVVDSTEALPDFVSMPGPAIVIDGSVMHDTLSSLSSQRGEKPSNKDGSPRSRSKRSDRRTPGMEEGTSSQGGSTSASSPVQVGDTRRAFRRRGGWCREKYGMILSACVGRLVKL